MLCFGLLSLLAMPLPSAAQEVLFREQFDSLDAWDPLTFRSIERHTHYSTSLQEQRTVLRVEASSSASAIVYEETFNVYEWPIVSWTWRAESVHATGDAATKDGDDYPVRLYVLFEYAPERLTFGQKLQYNTVKLLYGRYPPHATLNYIYANKVHSRRIIPNAFTDRAMMIVVDAGTRDIGTWREHTRNIVEDYRDAFGTDPPETATIAIMGDADNTEGESIAFVDWVQLSKER
jgi:hypothetical protein